MSCQFRNRKIWPDKPFTEDRINEKAENATYVGLSAFSPLGLLERRRFLRKGQLILDLDVVIYVHVDIAITPYVLSTNPPITIEIFIIANMFMISIMGMLAMVTCLM